MRLSAKGRYGLEALILMAESGDSPVSSGELAGRLGISKAYLEQILVPLKTAGLLTASKGAQGGYRLSRPPDRLTAWDVLSVCELSLAAGGEPHADVMPSPAAQAVDELIVSPAYAVLRRALETVTLSDLAARTEEYAAISGYMANL